MDPISAILDTGLWLVQVVAPFLIVLGVVIFVHEYGHYIVGRWCGIKALAFSIGMGPELFGWTDKRGTRWRLAAFPIGGYVLFKGDADASSATSDGEAIAQMSPEERRSTMAGAPLWARSATVAAGPIFNFLLTMALMTAVVLAVGARSDSPVVGAVSPGGQAAGIGLLEGDEIVSVDGAAVESFSGFLNTMFDGAGDPKEIVVERDGASATLSGAFVRPTQVSSVRAGGPAQAACVKPGDVILAVDGVPIGAFEDLQRAVSESDGRELTLTVQRGAGELLDLNVTPDVAEVQTAEATVERRLIIGVSADPNLGMSATNRSVGPVEALVSGVQAPFVMAGVTLNYLGSWVRGEVGGESLGGPIGIARMSSEAADTGFVGFIIFIATISTAIGLINLFPIPILDGGHLVFYAVEAVRGRPLGERAMSIATSIGLAAILALLVFATSNDLAVALSGFGNEC